MTQPDYGGNLLRWGKPVLRPAGVRVLPNEFVGSTREQGSSCTWQFAWNEVLAVRKRALGLLCGFLVVGCNSLGGNSASKDGGSSPSPFSFFQKKPADTKTDPLPKQGFSSATNPSGNSILAGQVMDNFNRRPTGAMIQVVEVQADPSQQKVEVAADSQGYFNIPGLKPGKNYQLVARVRDGERFYTGTALVVPPNPRVSIFIHEDMSIGGAGKATPNGSLDGVKPAETGTNVPGSTNSGSTVSPEKVARDTFAVAPGAILSIPSGGADRGGYAVPPPPLPFPSQLGFNGNTPDATPGSFSAFPSNPASASGPVPSCVLVGQKLDNFTLYDMNGQVWDYKKNKTGRMVLLDFWFSSCGPCLQSIPHLVELQKRYKSFGLEVIGIAYEKGTEEEKLSRVRPVRARYHMNYLTLFGGGGLEPCPVRTQFDVNSFPSLVLLDEAGNIVWRNRRDEGIDTRQLAELELEIRRGLGIRSR